MAVPAEVHPVSTAPHPRSCIKPGLISVINFVSWNQNPQYNKMYDFEALEMFCADSGRSSKLNTALQEFQQSLPQSDAQKLRADAGTTPDTQSVIHLLEEIEKKNANRKSRIIASRVEGILSSVQQFSAVADAFAGGDRVGALVWGSLKLFLLFSSNFAEYFDKISQRIAQLSTHCPRLAEYERLFPSSKRLQDALSDFYAVIVTFCTKALGAIQEKGVTRSVKAMWRPFKVDFKDLEEEMIDARREVKEEIQLASEQASYGIRLLLTDEIDDNREHRREQQLELQESRAFRTQQMSNLEENRRREIEKFRRDDERQKLRLLQRIPSHDYAAALRRAQDHCCEGTCKWLFGKPEFRRWLQRKGPKHLWCHGIPGCGKSVLMGSIAQYLKTASITQGNTAILYYFFDFQEGKTLKMSSFLRCILHQMIRLESLGPDFQKELESLFQYGMEPIYMSLVDSCIEAIRSFDRCYLLIDGADECDDHDQRLLKHFVRQIQKENAAQILITSLPELDMTTALDSCRVFQIMQQDLYADIQTFVQKRITEAAQFELRSCTPAQLEMIQEALQSLSGGMFLWADLQLKAICDTCEISGTPDAVPELLEALPRKLQSIYHRSLMRLAEKNDRQATLAKRVFQWIICGRRRLTVNELEEAISITSDQKSWQKPPWKLDYLKLCKITGNLLDYDKTSGTISLAHRTVQDFLMNCSDLPEVASFALEGRPTEQSLTDTCLTYLLFGNFQKSLVRMAGPQSIGALAQPANVAWHMAPRQLQRFNPLLSRTAESDRSDVINLLRSQLRTQSLDADPTYEFLDYTKRYWHEHCRYAMWGDQLLKSKLRRFLESTQIPSDWKPWEAILEEKPKPYWRLFYWTVMQGHPTLYSAWKDIVQEDERLYWLILWSDLNGHDIFLSACKKADMEQLELILSANGRLKLARPTREEFSRGLAETSRLGHVDMVERLAKDSHFKIEKTKDQGSRAVEEAADAGQLNIVEILLMNGASANPPETKERDRPTALQWAAIGGYIAIVERLLQAGAHVDYRPDGWYGLTALQAAAGEGHVEIVERLLVADADVNASAEGWKGRTALQAAAGGGHDLIVHQLLSRGADINAAPASHSGRFALQAAAEGGHLSIVEELLQGGADIKAVVPGFHELDPASVHSTALQGAAGGGHLAVVERLLQAYADAGERPVDLVDGTALRVAADGHHLTVFEHLLENRANGNEKDANSFKAEALELAAGGGFLPIVERLLEEGVIINAPTSKLLGTALQRAESGGHDAVVHRLLEWNKDVFNKVDRNPLP